MNEQQSKGIFFKVSRTKSQEAFSSCDINKIDDKYLDKNIKINHQTLKYQSIHQSV